MQLSVVCNVCFRIYDHWYDVLCVEHLDSGCCLSIWILSEKRAFRQNCIQFGGKEKVGHDDVRQRQSGQRSNQRGGSQLRTAAQPGGRREPGGGRRRPAAADYGAAEGRY